MPVDRGELEPEVWDEPEEPAGLPEWGRPEAEAVLAEAYGERLKTPVYRQCLKLARQQQARGQGGSDTLREYVSVAALLPYEPGRGSLRGEPAAVVSIAVRHAIYDAERFGYVTGLAAMHMERGKRVPNLAYDLLSTQADDGGSSRFDEASWLGWLESEAESGETRQRAVNRERLDAAVDKLSEAAPHKIEAWRLVVGEGRTHRDAKHKLGCGLSTVGRWVKWAERELKTELGVEDAPRKRRRQRKPPAGPTEPELALLAGLLTVDRVTAVLARKASQSGKLPLKHRGAKVTRTMGPPRQRVTCVTPFGLLAVSKVPFSPY